jgi:hypothetical protein
MHHLRNTILALTVISLCSTGCMIKKSEKKVEKEETFSERDEMEKAMEQEFIMTVDPALGYIPKERLIAALAYQRRLIAARGSGINAITWAERGPNNIAGRTRALFIDARDATGNTVFAASVSGGIWKTTNFKTATNPTWVQVNPNMGSLAVCALAQDSSNKNIMYAGTGEGWFNSDAVRGNGIWKSTDGGTTWNQLASTDSTANSSSHNYDFVNDIVVSNGIVFASARPSRFCNRGGVFRSADGGTTWTRVIGTQKPWATTCDAGIYDFYAADLEVASNGDIYATTGYNNKGASDTANYGRIFRSSAATNGTNVGAINTWTDITPPGSIWQRIEIAVAPGNPAVIYALLQGQGDGIGAIKKSTDFGATWSDLTIPTWCNQGSNSADFTNGQAFYDLIVQVDPTNENNVIIGGIDLFKSTNGGTTFNQLTQWARNCTTLPVVHADQHNVIFYPGSGSELIATNDGGIYYSSNGGTTWATSTIFNLNGANKTTISDKNIGYNVTQLYACDIHPLTTNYFLVGSQDNGSFELTSPGLGNGVEASIGGDGGYCHIDQTDGSLQILSYVYNNFYYSRNGGTSFIRTSFNDNGFFINPSDLDDGKKVLYSSSISGQMGLVSNLAVGTPSFSNVSISSLGIRKVSAVKVDPTVSGGGSVWLGGYDSTGSLRPIVIKVSSANTTPVTDVATQLSSAPLGAYISSIDIDPSNGNHILVTLSNYGIVSVYESTDGGNSFNNIEGNLPDVPVRWGMIIPANAGVDGIIGGGILVATETGVWFAQTTNGSLTSWLPQASGLPNVRCDMLRYRPSDNLLAVATHGRGLFTANLTPVVTGIPSVPNTKNFIDYISTTQQQVFVKVGNLNTTTMEVQVFAMDGKLVYSSKTKYASQNIPISQLARGGYILKIYGNKNEQFTKQFIK